jgi:cytochrome c
MRRWLVAGILLMSVVVANVQAQGDVRRGEEAFRQCGACHSLELGRHLTGPSLVGIVGRSAGSIAGFRRYSTALEQSGITWTKDVLDRWLQSPSNVVPGTSMRIRAITDATVRQDLIAFLETVKSEPETTAGAGMQVGGMPNLKEVPPGQRVTAIYYCPDAYWVTVATGATHTFWEFNLRFKTDSSPDGPSKGQPAIVGQGMQGDRAQVVFSEPAEISNFIVEACLDG